MKSFLLLIRLLTLMVLLHLIGLSFEISKSSFTNHSTSKSNSKNLLSNQAEHSSFTDTKNKGIIQQGWLRIASDQLTDQSIHRDIPLPDHRTKPINYSSGTSSQDIPIGVFRINSEFSEDQVSIPSPESFYFRLSPNLLYYSEGKDDMRVVDSIHIKSISEMSSNV